MEAKSDETKAEKCFIMLHGAYNAYGLRNRGEKAGGLVQGTWR